MARQAGFESHASGWRDLVWAGAAATLVTVALVAGVVLAWLIGRGPSSTPALTAPDPTTPTPRAIMIVRSTPVPTLIAQAPTEPAAEATVAETPELLAMTVDNETASGEDSTLFEATTSDAFTSIAAGPWAVADQMLINDGSRAVAEPWLTIARTPSSNFAVEAEIRVASVLESVCDQSFGIAGGSPSAGLVFGGGVIFPCSGDSSAARLTNVAQWEDGYNADQVIAESSFTPEDEWRTYRFELHDGEVRLLVDGDEVVSGVADPGIDPAAIDGEAGIWSQGVGLEIRRLAVFPLSE